MLKCFKLVASETVYVQNLRFSATSSIKNHTDLESSRPDFMKNIVERTSGEKNKKPIHWVKWWEGDYSHHPGKCNMPVIEIPEDFSKSARRFLEPFNTQTISTIGNNLDTYLHSRRLCVDRNREALPLFNQKIPMKYQLQQFDEFVNLSAEGFHLSRKMLKTERNKENAVPYKWKQVVYDKLNSASYLVARSPGCYASTLRVLNEIKQNVQDFNPKSILDFGSGTGTSVWAANKLWQDSLKEYVCIDSSTEMNQLSFFLLSGGDYDRHLPGIFIRQYLPISLRSEFDLVVSSYSLSELPTQKDRLALLKMLWGKTKRYLVIIERGNFYGYYGIMEARNLLTKGLEGGNIKKANTWKRFENDATIFAPCPHKKDCPLWGSTKSCTVTQKYFTPIYVKKFKRTDVEKETFSYIVLEKNSKNSTREKSWPRIIDNPSRNPQSKCVTCHSCTPDGNIEHLSISKQKHGNKLVILAKKCARGDLLPLHNLKFKS